MEINVWVVNQLAFSGCSFFLSGTYETQICAHFYLLMQRRQAFLTFICTLEVSRKSSSFLVAVSSTEKKFVLSIVYKKTLITDIFILSQHSTSLPLFAITHADCDVAHLTLFIFFQDTIASNVDRLVKYMAFPVLKQTLCFFPYHIHLIHKSVMILFYAIGRSLEISLSVMDLLH